MKLAIIPARGGSKRVPRKNVKLFAGQPMIAYAIAAARASAVFDRIVVSTDDEEIAEVARSHGALTPFMRPPELSDDHTGTVPVIVHALDACRALGWEAELACCIYPGVPLLAPDDLVAALALLQRDDARPTDYAFTVAAFPSAVQRALRRSDAGRMSPLAPENIERRSQDLEPCYYDAGQFYWGGAAAWRSGVSPHMNGWGWPVPAWRAVDIDTPDDWRRAELLYRALHG